jgi:hypothetical protein
MRDDDAEKTYKVEGVSLTTHAVGSTSAENGAASFILDRDGNARMTFRKPLNRVGIENLIDVEGHTIKRAETAVSHHIVFRDRSEARFSYNSSGRILELTGSSVSVLTDGSMVFKRRNDPCSQ